MSARVVTVFGATGTQGSSVIKALLADRTFTPRAVTRNPNSEKALRIKHLGAEVVQGDLWDVPSLKNAMNGAEAVYGVTDYYAAIEAGVKFFVWSSLPHATRLSNRKYPNVYHFDNKANVDDYLRDGQLPHANLHTGWFSENTWNGLLFLRASHTPNSPQYFTWVERDLGQCVLALLKHYKDDSAHILGETFYAVSDKMNYTDYANAIERVLGKPIRFVTGATAGVEEFDQMYEFESEFDSYPHTVIPDPRLERLGVKFHSNETFAEEELKNRYA